MKEIKFRAWDKEVNHMYYNSGHVSIDMKGHCFNLQTGVQLEPLLFTGLRDKNGKKIYEGDIVEFINHRYYHGNYEVRFCNGSFDVHSENENGNPNTDYLYDYHNDYKVVGNIYENLELLT